MNFDYTEDDLNYIEYDYPIMKNFDYTEEINSRIKSIETLIEKFLTSPNVDQHRARIKATIEGWQETDQYLRFRPAFDVLDSFPKTNPLRNWIAGTVTASGAANEAAAALTIINTYIYCQFSPIQHELAIQDETTAMVLADVMFAWFMEIDKEG